MQVQTFLNMTKSLNISFYTGVPDSQLSALCKYLEITFGPASERHVVAANEGGAVGLAAGHYLATGRPAMVYLQNSGLGNAVNPICSLLNDQVYAIPALFVIGWRGEPGIKDEPQHIFQGEITLQLLACLKIPYTILDQDSDAQTLADIKDKCEKQFAAGGCYAVVVRKNALNYNIADTTPDTGISTESEAASDHDAQIAADKIRAGKTDELTNLSAHDSGDAPNTDSLLSREEALAILTDAAPDQAVFVSTTGKLSRELFEIREKNRQGHGNDFLTVGSMGHTLMIAQGIALAKKNTSVWCLDGDGAMLMHMGSVAVAGLQQSENLYHFVINNGAHESVGGMPTAASSEQISLADVARACGYQAVYKVSHESGLNKVLEKLSDLKGPVFVEIITNTNVRADLGRPTATPAANKNAFMANLEAIK